MKKLFQKILIFILVVRTDQYGHSSLNKLNPITYIIVLISAVIIGIFSGIKAFIETFKDSFNG